MFYQLKHAESTDNFTKEFGIDFNFPHHLHGTYELIVILEGTMEVTIENRSYILNSGDGVLIFPDQVHSLNTIDKSKHVLWIFSSQHIKHFSATHKSFKAENNMFHPSKAIVDALIDTNEQDSVFRIKGLLYLIVSEFDKDRCYISRIAEKKDLLQKIFDFVKENYGGDCQLKDLSDSIGYSYVYLSRYFKARTGISFTSYVNHYRINEACYQLLSRHRDITEIAFECGFDSVRSFNRNFKAYMHISPHEYRGRQ